MRSASRIMSILMLVGLMVTAAQCTKKWLVRFENAGQGLFCQYPSELARIERTSLRFPLQLFLRALSTPAHGTGLEKIYLEKIEDDLRRELCQIKLHY